MKALSGMKTELAKDETELLDLTDSTLKKLSAMTDKDYDKLELHPNFDEQMGECRKNVFLNTLKVQKNVRKQH